MTSFPRESIPVTNLPATVTNAVCDTYLEECRRTGPGLVLSRERHGVSAALRHIGRSVDEPPARGVDRPDAPLDVHRNGRIVGRRGKCADQRHYGGQIAGPERKRHARDGHVQGRRRVRGLRRLRVRDAFRVRRRRMPPPPMKSRMNPRPWITLRKLAACMACHFTKNSLMKQEFPTGFVGV